ncbi:MAG TPA: hypothetical protein VHH73_04385 [Verrucomicrobiae bacterium]|nr:hypothetical protein [Verrucomicrobiae bacterium]
MASLPGPTNYTANGNSTGPWVSGNGAWVCFNSDADNLTTNKVARGPVANWINAYAREMASGKIQLLSVSADGVSGANANSLISGVSRDGQRVVFESTGSDIVTNDNNGTGNIFVRDLTLGKTLLVSAGQAGGAANGASTGSSISADGRYVVFQSDASNLVAGDTNGVTDVFVRDLEAGTTTLVSGNQGGNTISTQPLISANGRRVAFLNYPPIIMLGSTNQGYNIFVRDLDTSQTTWITSGFSTASSAWQYALSEDGDHIVFRDVNTLDVYWRDLSQTTNVLVHHQQGQSSVAATGVDISGDGRYAVYDVGGLVYRWDKTTGKETWVGPKVVGAGDYCDSPFMSVDGRMIFFESLTTNLVAGATGDTYQWYVRDMTTGDVQLAIARLDGTFPDVQLSAPPSVSDDGRFAAFDAFDDQITPGDANNSYDAFVRDLTAKRTILLSSALNPVASLSGNGTSALGASVLSADGNRLVYQSLAENLVANDSNGVSDIFLFDINRQANQLVSVNAAGTRSGNDRSYNPIIARNGRFVAFLSRAADLAAGTPTNRLERLYLRDVDSAITTVPGGMEALLGTSTFSQLSISAGGEAMAFLYGTSLYYWNISSNTLVKIVQATPTISQAVISPDAKWVAFVTGSTGVFVWEAGSGQKLTVVQGQIASNPLSFSRDGKTLFLGMPSASPQLQAYPLPPAAGKAVAFQPGYNVMNEYDSSGDGKLVAYTARNPSPENPRQLFLADLSSGLVTTLSPNLGPTNVGTAPYRSPRISANGRFVLFRSEATDLVPAPANPDEGLFLADLQMGTTTLIDWNAAGTAKENSRPGPALMSDDGKTIVFSSLATDLVSGDDNLTSDIFYVRLTDSTTGDSDGDGLPDAWETQYFGSLSRDGSGDFDGDGQSDRAEYLAGTDPARADSALRCTITTSAPSGWQLQWSSVPGKTYHVQSRADLGAGAWADLGGNVTATTAVSTTLVSPNAGEATTFYRVVVVQ